MHLPSSSSLKNLREKKKRKNVKIYVKRKKKRTDFPGGTVVKNLPANAGDMGSSPGPGRSHMPRSN